MIVKITSKKLPNGKRARGKNPVGLMLYLFGPGKRNEHEDQHIVTAAPSFGIPDGQRYPDKRDVIELGHDLDGPHKLFGTEFPGGHIWHMSLSNPKQDRALSDEEWAEIAHASMDALGFSEKSGKAPCRWVAVRHGLSSEGNDHIHIAVDLIREDGTRASIWKDREKMSRLAKQFERKYGLTVVEGRTGAGLPGVTLAEQEVAKRNGQPEPARARLARAVRAASVAAVDEAEFVRRLRGSGVLARPRYAAGGMTEVVGYSVALRAPEGENIIWFGGGKLAPDLTLTRLREQWSDDPDARAAALEEWSQTSSTQRAGREARRLRQEAWSEAAEQIEGAMAELAAVPVDDWETWAGVARESAGVYAALSARIEGTHPGALARAADTLARSAQSRRDQPHASRRSNAARVFRGVQMVAIQAGAVGRTPEGEAMLLRAMARVVRLLHDSHVARGEATQAARLTTLAREQLLTLHQAQATAATVTPTRTNEPPARRPPQPPQTRRDQDLGR